MPVPFSMYTLALLLPMDIRPPPPLMRRMINSQIPTKISAGKIHDKSCVNQLLLGWRVNST